MISRRLFGVILCIVAACGGEPSRGHIRLTSGIHSVGQRDGTFRRFETVEFVLPQGFVMTDPGSATLIDASGRRLRPTSTSLQSGPEQKFKATFEVPEHFHRSTLRVDSFVVNLQHSLITRTAR
jgi:hypothetical protein